MDIITSFFFSAHFTTLTQWAWLCIEFYNGLKYYYPRAKEYGTVVFCFFLLSKRLCMIFERVLLALDWEFEGAVAIGEWAISFFFRLICVDLVEMVRAQGDEAEAVVIGGMVLDINASPSTATSRGTTAPGKVILEDLNHSLSRKFDFVLEMQFLLVEIYPYLLVASWLFCIHLCRFVLKLITRRNNC